MVAPPTLHSKLIGKDNLNRAIAKTPVFTTVYLRHKHDIVNGLLNGACEWTICVHFRHGIVCFSFSSGFHGNFGIGCAQPIFLCTTLSCATSSCRTKSSRVDGPLVVRAAQYHKTRR